MFIAMNRFRISEGREEIFEDIWRKRESHLDAACAITELDFRRLRKASRQLLAPCWRVAGARVGFR